MSPKQPPENPSPENENPSEQSKDATGNESERPHASLPSSNPDIPEDSHLGTSLLSGVVRPLKTLKRFRPLSGQQALWGLVGSVILCGSLVWAAVTFQMALPGYRYQFPRDHASHPDYKTEWWYYTGHLQTAAHQRYGYELTFFRIGNAEAPANQTDQTPWNTRNLYAAHFALSDENRKQFHYNEKLNRAGTALAGARTDVYSVWNELWLAEGLGNRMILRADSPDGKQEIHLMLHSEKPPVIHGINGVSQKASCTGCASHYYSLTRLQTDGFILLDGKAQPVTGLSWMDHEFGSNQLASNQKGWDWFSLQLDDKSDVMLYLLRQDDGRIDPNSSGTVVAPDGRSRHLTLKDFTVTASGKTWRSPTTQGVYPMGWTVRIPSEQLELNVTPAFENQELSTGGSTGVAYWEGSSHVQGTRAGRTVQGQAYVEMTGYAAKQTVKNKL